MARKFSNSRKPNLLVLLTVLVLGMGLAIATYIIATFRSTDSAPSASTTKIPIIGAIRFDAWSDTNYRWFPNGGYRRLYSDYLAPAQWHYRLPFFAKVISANKVEMNGDTQAVVDQEIQAASKAGLSYWAFNFSNVYWKNSVLSADVLKHNNLNYGLKRYMTSKYKNQLNFALTAFAGEQKPGDDPSVYWRKNTVPELVKYMKNSSYQKVLGDRPLLYIFDIGGMAKQGNSAKGDIEAVRTQARAAGLGNPYIVGMVFSPTDSAIKTLGVDAVSAYSASEYNVPILADGRPFSDLMNANAVFRDEAKKSGADVVPIVNAGWDRRPHWIDPEETHSPWYKQGTLAQIAQNLKNAIEWNKANTSVAPANTILMYAWNEYGEGGWLSPSLQIGPGKVNAAQLTSTDRLDAIQKVIELANPLPTINSGGLTPSFGKYYVWVKGLNYGRSMKVQLYDTNQKPWGDPITFVSNDSGGAFLVSSLSPPSLCNKTKECLITAVFQDAVRGIELSKFTFILGQTEFPQPPVISDISLVRAYSPWYVGIRGTRLSQSVKVRVIDDADGRQWGSDFAVGSPLDLSSLTFQLPSNLLPSGCNKTKACSVTLYLVDSTGKLSAGVKLVLPAI